MSRFHHIVNAILGAWELARIGFVSRFRGGNAYWRWRRETAFGAPGMNVKKRTDVGVTARAAAMLRFGAWVARMKRFR